MKREEFLERSRNIHGYKYTYIDLPNKITLKDKILISFKGNIFSQVVNKHLMGKCPEKSTPNRTTLEFILQSNSIWKNKYNYSLTDYKNALTKVKIVHYGVVYEQTPTAHLNKMSPEFRIYNESILNRNKIIFKSIEKFLRENNIEYLKNHQMGNTSISFDFYIPSMISVIDFDISGYYDTNDKLNSLEQLKLNDKIKSDYCEDNYINLIKIRHDQTVDKVLWDNLKTLINLRKVKN